MDEGNTGVNALLGGGVTSVLGLTVPFGPAFGGFVAGHLEGGDRSDGVRVAVLSGLVGAPVTFAVAWLVGWALIGGAVSIPTVAGSALVAVLLAGTVWGVYVVGFSAVGGWIGNYVKYDTGLDL